MRNGRPIATIKVLLLSKYGRPDQCLKPQAAKPGKAGKAGKPEQANK